MFVRCVAMIVLLSGEKLVWGLSRQPRGRAAARGSGAFSLALILLYGIDMSKARGIYKKILTLELTRH